MQHSLDRGKRIGARAVVVHAGSAVDQGARDVALKTMREHVLPMLDGLEVYTRRHTPAQIPVYEELARQHGLLMTVGTDYHGFNGDDYVAPKTVIDIRYLEKLGSRVEWPAVEQAS